MEQRTGKNESKNGKRPSTLVIIGVLAVLLVAATVFAILFKSCSTKRTLPKNNDSTATGVQTEKNIKTPIGNFTVPRELAKSADADVETSKEGNLFKARFYCKAGKRDVTLFTIFVGMEGKGYKLGSAPDKSGKTQDVWLDIAEIKKESDWSETEYKRINELQSYVNDFIEQINNIDGLKSAKQ